MTRHNATASVRVVVDVRRSAEGTLWVHVHDVEQDDDLGQVLLGELPVLLEALLADSGG